MLETLMFLLGVFFGFFVMWVWKRHGPSSYLQSSTPKNLCPPSQQTFHYDPPAHPRLLCTVAHVAPYGFIDPTRPIKGVWMCGCQGSNFEQCKGAEIIEGEGLGSYGKHGKCCKHFQLDIGACLKAGRATTTEELTGEMLSNEHRPN